MGALGGLLQGILAGKQLRGQMQRAALDRQAMQQEMDQRQQQQMQYQHDSAVKNIMDRMTLEAGGARLVSNGMVEDLLQSPDAANPASDQTGSGTSPSAVQAGAYTPLDTLRGGSGGSGGTIAPDYSPQTFTSLQSPQAQAQQAVMSGSNPASGEYTALDSLRAQTAPPSAAAAKGLRKARSADVVTIPGLNGEKIQYELPTPEERAQRQGQMADAAAMRQALGQAKADTAAKQWVLKMRGQKLPDSAAQALGIDNTNPQNVFLPEEIPGLMQKAVEMLSANRVTTAPGTTVQQLPGLTDAPGTAPRTIATGGPVTTGPNGAFETWLPGYYQQHGIASPQPKDKSAAYEQFLKLKPEDAESEVALAQRAARGDKDAEAALRRLDESKRAARPVTNINTGIPGMPPISANTPHGEDFLRTVDPGTSSTVRAISEGRMPLPSSFALTRPYWQDMLKMVGQYDPGFSTQRAEIRKSFTTGTDGRNIGALNTAAVHLDQFEDAANAMVNGSFTPGNAAWNSLRSVFGSQAPTNFAALKSAVSGEMASALKGNATDAEIANISKTLQAANSPQQLAGAVETNLHVLGAKLNTYHQRYQQQIPGDQVYSPVLPAARQVFQKHGFDPVQQGSPAAAAGGHVIQIGNKQYQYNGSGDTANLKNYTELGK